MNYADEIDNYLFGHLSAQQMRDFEAQIGSDAALAAAVEQHRTEHEAMRQLRHEALRQRMKTWDAGSKAEAATATHKPETGMTAHRGGRFRYLQWAVAASFLFAAAWFLLRNPQPDAVRLAMDYHPTQQETKRAGNDSSDPLEQALQLLKKGEAQGLTQIEQLPPDHPRYAEVPLFKSDYYFVQKNYAQVIALCTPLARQTENKDLRQEAEWRIALAFLADEGVEGASFKEWMKRIRQEGSDHLYHSEAAELAEKTGL